MKTSEILNHSVEVAKSVSGRQAGETAGALAWKLKQLEERLSALEAWALKRDKKYAVPTRKKRQASPLAVALAGAKPEPRMRITEVPKRNFDRS